MVFRFHDSIPTILFYVADRTELSSQLHYNNLRGPISSGPALECWRAQLKATRARARKTFMRGPALPSKIVWTGRRSPMQISLLWNVVEGSISSLLYGEKRSAFLRKEAFCPGQREMDRRTRSTAVVVEQHFFLFHVNE